MTKPFLSILVTEEEEYGTFDTVTEIPLDARLSSSYSFQAQSTDSPVEEGSRITDHVHLQPDRVSIEGFVSDSPLQATSVSTAPTLKGDAGQGGTALGMRTQGAYDALEAVYRARIPLTVITEFAMYEDMIIENLEIPRSRDRGGDGLWFSLSLKKISTVETLTAALPPDVVAKLKKRRKKTTDRQKKNVLLQQFRAQKVKEVELGLVKGKMADEQTQAFAKATGSDYTSAYGKTK